VTGWNRREVALSVARLFCSLRKAAAGGARRSKVPPCACLRQCGSAESLTDVLLVNPQRCDSTVNAGQEVLPQCERGLRS
jgi:hypothetical protein